MFSKNNSSPNSNNSSVQAKVAYGEWVSYKENTAIRFQDFDLEFLGTEENGFYPGTERRMAPIYRFKAFRDNREVVFKWSMGTGDIAPAVFDLAGSKFFIEIENSEILGRPNMSVNGKADSLLVAWPEKEFRKHSR